MRTLCIDIGGTGIKAMVLGPDGQSLTERSRVATPQPATPEAIFEVLDAMGKSQGEFDRISVGFPGVVKEGVVKTAPHLDPSWAGVDLKGALEQRFQRPARVANDALIQGLGVIEGRGFEMVITLGTGLGCGLYTDGHPISVELGHHPIGDHKTYEDLVGEAARKEVGNKRWRKRVHKVIKLIDRIFNYQRLYIGGGNARLLDQKDMPENVVLVDNVSGLIGGLRLWA